jgi:hypothetical protein
MEVINVMVCTWRYQREATRICISKKNRQHNDQKKKVQKDKQQSGKHTHKTKDRVTSFPRILWYLALTIHCKPWRLLMSWCALHLFITHSLKCTHGCLYTWMYVITLPWSFLIHVAGITRRMPLVGKKLLTLPDQMSSPPVLVLWKLVNNPLGKCWQFN